MAPQDTECDWPDTEENQRRTVFCAHMHMQRSKFEELCRCTCLSVGLPICQSVCLPISLSVCACLSVCLPVC